MFALETDNSVIGKYLGTEIKNHYKNVRSFCKDYIRHKGLDSSDVNLLNKYQNRIGQILSGEKGIQLHDLPYFSEMLGISCEAILSAGRYHVPESTHVTNYDIAHSDKKSVWKKYLEREDKLFLNADEYGKTVIDYALDFKNYKFIDFLMDEKYIWFIDSKDINYPFSAGTKIKRREWNREDISLYVELYEEKLRTDIVALGIEKGDLCILKEMRARENHQIYSMARWDHFNEEEFEKGDNPNLIDAISRSSEEAIFYFSEEFEIKVNGKDETFVFPYLSKLINKLIENRKTNLAKIAIENAIKHNNNTYDKLLILIDNAKKADWWIDDPKEILRQIMWHYYFDKNKDFVSFMDLGNHCDGLVTDIIHCDVKSGAPEIQKLVAELNESYQRIIDLKEGK